MFSVRTRRSRPLQVLNWNLSYRQLDHCSISLVNRQTFSAAQHKFSGASNIHSSTASDGFEAYQRCRLFLKGCIITVSVRWWWAESNKSTFDHFHESKYHFASLFLSFASLQESWSSREKFEIWNFIVLQMFPSSISCKTPFQDTREGLADIFPPICWGRTVRQGNESLWSDVRKV